MDLKNKSFIKLITYFNDNDLEYVALGDVSLFPNLLTDLDICVKNFKHFQQIMKEFCSKNNCKIVRIQQHATGIRFDLAFNYENSKFVIIPGPDVLFFPTRRIFDFYGASFNQILKNRILSDKNIFIPSTKDAFIYYLTRRIDKGSLNESNITYLTQLWHDDSEGIQQQLEHIYPKKTKSIITKSIDENNWSTISHLLNTLRKDIKIKKLPNIKYISWSFKRIFSRIYNPSGCFITFFGPDGSGKTSVIDEVKQSLHEAFSQTHQTHLRPRLGYKTDNTGATAVTDPHGKPPRGFIASILKLGYLSLDYILGYFTVVRPKLVRSTLVIFDRYFQDILVDPTRYRHGAPEWITRIFEKLIPHPELIILLDAPAEVLQSRKQEVTLEESARQRKRYREILEQYPECVIINSNQPLEQVVNDTNQAIINMLDKRFQRKLNLL